MSEHNIIHNYLKTLAKYLARLNKIDADEVIREIESHIYDALDAKGENSDIEAILDGFGPPRELATTYVKHILEGMPPPAGFRAIQKVKKGATKSLYYTTAGIGYLFSAVFMLFAIFKPFVPEKIGVWVPDHGYFIAIGARSEIPDGAVEILGLWAIPVAILFSIGTAYLTRRILTVLKSRL